MSKRNLILSDSIRITKNNKVITLAIPMHTGIDRLRGLAIAIRCFHSLFLLLRVASNSTIDRTVGLDIVPPSLEGNAKAIVPRACYSIAI